MDARVPSVESDRGPRAAARGILMGVIADETAALGDRVAALEAMGALEDHLPHDVVLSAAPERPGELDDVLQLLIAAARQEDDPAAARGISIAQGHLRRRQQERAQDANGGRG